MHESINNAQLQTIPFRMNILTLSLIHSISTDSLHIKIQMIAIVVYYAVCKGA